MKISQGKIVEIEYTLTVDGEQVESSKEQGPLRFKIGAGKVVPGLEKALTGHEEGETLSFDIPPEEGYGGAQVEMPRSQFPPGAELKEGEAFTAKTADGQSVQFVVRAIKDDVVVLDHPMASKTLHFDLKVLVVREPKKKKKKKQQDAPPIPIPQVEELEADFLEED